MVKRIEWSDSAKNQLKNIYDYYALAAGKGVANKLVKRIMERTDILILHPYSGTKEELLLDYPEEYRYLVVNNYKIIYWLYEENAIIASVFDCRQNPEKIKQIKK